MAGHHSCATDQQRVLCYIRARDDNFARGNDLGRFIRADESFQSTLAISSTALKRLQRHECNIGLQELATLVRNPFGDTNEVAQPTWLPPFRNFAEFRIDEAVGEEVV